MTSEQATGERLRAALRFDLKDLPAESIARWLPQIEDETLRTDLMDNPRLRERIQRQVLAQDGLVSDEIEDFGDDEATLLWLLEQDTAELSRKLGYAWMSNLLADLMVTGKLAEHCPGIPRESLTKALRFREFSPAADTVSPSSNPEDEGGKCLQAFLSTMPRAAANGLRVRLGLPQTTFIDPQRAGFCRNVLSTFVEKSE